jgi:hypothetical protein
MKVADLIEMLEDLPEDVEVRFAHQPNYPFEYSVACAVLVDYAEHDPNEDGEDDVQAEPVVYLVEGTQLGYLPGVACREIGWRE